MKKSLIALSGLLMLSGTSFAAAVDSSACVDSNDIIEHLGIPENVQLGVIEVKKLDGLTGVCAYVFNTPGGRQVVIGGEKYLFNGKLLDVENKIVVQDDILKKYQHISLDDYKELKELATLKFGNGSREVVLITDPECPYCKRLTQTLSDVEDLTVHLVFAPLQNHENGIRLSKSLVAGKSKFSKTITEAEVYFNYLNDENNANDVESPEYDEIQKKVKKLMRKNAISGGVPKLFFSNGTYEIGALPKEIIEKTLSTLKTVDTSQNVPENSNITKDSNVVALTDADKKVRISETPEEDDVIVEEADEEVNNTEDDAESSENITKLQEMNTTMTDAEKHVMLYKDVDRPTLREAEVYLKEFGDAAEVVKSQSENFKKN